MLVHATITMTTNVYADVLLDDAARQVQNAFKSD